MIRRFRKITDGLYRGSAPSDNDVINLHKYLGVNKIVSLDKETGEAIDPVCQQLGIEHIIIPLNGRKGPLAKLFSYDLYSLLMDNGPTYFHCHEGKDRTGFVAALFKCMYMGYTYDEAMAEAKSLGFGVGVSPFIIGMYSNLLKKCCQEKEKTQNLPQENIVSNEREYKSFEDGRGSYLDQATQGSFAPFISKTRQYPYDNVYNPGIDQYPTRDNYNHSINPYVEEGSVPQDTLDIPMVGEYDNIAGPMGTSPINFYSGFLT
jgi:hypothetical protein